MIWYGHTAEKKGRMQDLWCWFVARPGSMNAWLQFEPFEQFAAQDHADVRRGPHGWKPLVPVLRHEQQWPAPPKRSEAVGIRIRSGMMRRVRHDKVYAQFKWFMQFVDVSHDVSGMFWIMFWRHKRLAKWSCECTRALQSIDLGIFWPSFSTFSTTIFKAKEKTRGPTGFSVSPVCNLRWNNWLKYWLCEAESESFLVQIDLTTESLQNLSPSVVTRKKETTLQQLIWSSDMGSYRRIKDSKDEVLTNGWGRYRKVKVKTLSLCEGPQGPSFELWSWNGLEMVLMGPPRRVLWPRQLLGVWNVLWL